MNSVLTQEDKMRYFDIIVVEVINGEHAKRHTRITLETLFDSVTVEQLIECHMTHVGEMTEIMRTWQNSNKQNMLRSV